MLIRFVLENVFSFGAQREFNTMPNTRLKTLDHHCYDFDGFPLLKMSAIYGANGAGKSNLIKGMFVLQSLVLDGKVPYVFKDNAFKFNPNPQANQLFAVEFIQGQVPFYYGLSVHQGRIVTEELYRSGLGKRKDELIYERKTDESGVSSLIFRADFEKDEKSQVLKSILLEEFVKPNEPVFKLLARRDNKYLAEVKLAFSWFSDTLQMISPKTKPIGLAHWIDVEPNFKSYAQDLISSLNIGVESLSTEKVELEEFFGKDNANELVDLKRSVEESVLNMAELESKAGDQVLVVKENGKFWVKTLKIHHKGKDDQVVRFDLKEESDGTVRLLDFVPAFMDVITEPRVFLIDEIERSIHPLLIKELVRKFSHDSQTKGQLIFTTHESNLLDQELFRQDEIWFAEKTKEGETDLYSLSDFKEHKTIDIRKGYLSGRYGAIPFLGNLSDLNWHEYVTE
ncbi:MAG: ATP-binding protein [Algoriphagus sp.]|nr:ATP-binding protein [Algoriphagus sp.]